MLPDLAEAISITTLRIWKNNIGKGGGIKDFFKEDRIKEKGMGRLFEKVGDTYPLQTMVY